MCFQTTKSIWWMISTHVKSEWSYGTLRFELNAFDKQQLQLVNQQPGMKLTGLGKHN